MRPCPLSAVLHAQESREHENNHRNCQVLSKAASRAFAKATAYVARTSSWPRVQLAACLISHSACQHSARCICISFGAATAEELMSSFYYHGLSKTAV